MQAPQLQEQIIRLVADLAGPNLREPLTAESEIMTSKLIDSFGLVQLVLEIEQQFGVSVRTEDMTLEHFSTIGGIVRLLGSYQEKN